MVAFPLSDQRQPVLIFCYKTDQATERLCFDLPPNQFCHSDKGKAPIIYLESLGVFFFFIFFSPCELLKVVRASAFHQAPPCHHIDWHVLIQAIRCVAGGERSSPS